MKTAHRQAASSKRRWQANPLSWIQVLNANCDQSPVVSVKIDIKVKTAFELLRTGGGEDKDFLRVGAAFNVALVRAESIDPLAEQTMLAGCEAMRRCQEIKDKHGRSGFYGPDLTAAQDAMDLYSEILHNSQPLQMERASEEAMRRHMRQSQGVLQ